MALHHSDTGSVPPSTPRQTVVRGGRAHLHGMTLFNRNYAVKATRRLNGDVVFRWMTYASYRRRMQLAVFGLGLLFLVSLLYIPGEDVPVLLPSHYLTGLVDRMSIWLLLIALPYVVCQYTSLGGYHAAEHQVISACIHGELTPERIQQTDRTSPYCGTVYISVVMAALLPLVFIPVDSLYYLAVAAGLLLLVVLLDRSHRFRRHALVRKLGLAYQRYITTKRATQEQVMVALCCAAKLAELEHSK